ncbi:MAG: TetR/AcrR family transcriptional regulator [Bacilli bacterium]|nr:TetR/AcrR family transcriptional regulator [Bacilli bacterium]
MNTKRESVLSASKELFSLYGYRKVSMNEIAAKAGVTKKTIYTYFSDKNELIKCILMDEINKMKRLADSVYKKDISFEDKIHEVIMLQLDYRNSSRLIANYLSEYEEGKLNIYKDGENIFNKTIQSELKLRLDVAIEEGYIKKFNTDVAAFLIYKIYVALMFELDYDIDKEEVIDNIMSILRVWLLK